MLCMISFSPSPLTAPYRAQTNQSLEQIFSQLLALEILHDMRVFWWLTHAEIQKQHTSFYHVFSFLCVDKQGEE